MRSTNAHPPKRVLWTRGSTEKLKELLDKKVSIGKISNLLNRTEKSIRRKCERLNLSSSTTYTKNNKDGQN